MNLQQRILTMMLKTPEATASGATAPMFDPAIRRDDVATMPALAIYAGTAQVLNVEDMKKILPNYELTQIAGAGHFLMMEKPKEFNEQLIAFLEKIRL